MFKRVSRSRNIKVCLSSRPWPVFRDAFHGLPSLALQDLTYNDIEAYINSALEENILTEIVQRASNVFLWVVLVVRSLLQGLRNQDGINDLTRRLCEIPVDLEGYFNRMLQKLDRFYLAEARQLF